MTSRLSSEQASAVLRERREARQHLTTFAARVPVPGSPIDEAADDARIPLIETQQAQHHALILSSVQQCMQTRHGRLMILAPPGSAKSTYATVVAPSWYLGTHPDSRVILASYGDELARKHGRRTRQLLRAAETQGILQCSIDPESRAVDAFGLTNGSEYIACGILGGITGNRAHGLIIDDPIKGRAEADSETIRERTYDAYQDDLLTRLVPGGWVVIIQTRWHEDDLAGRILPADWAGESGDIACRDGHTWRVLCLQAECTSPTDPLRREIGAMLWPEWFDARHWETFRLNRRTWSSLYQQVPAPAEGILFRRDDMGTYDRVPEGMRIIGASDFAVTPDGGDWTELGIAGIADDDSIYLLDWWRGQTGPEIWIERMVDMIVKHQPLAWFGEGGPIARAVDGQIKSRMSARRAPCRIEWMPSVSDKPTRAQPIIATAGMGRLWWPRAAWTGELQRQCLVFPAGTPDDGVDTLSLIGRGAATLGRRSKPRKVAEEPVTEHAWML